MVFYCSFFLSTPRLSFPPGVCPWGTGNTERGRAVLQSAQLQSAPRRLGTRAKPLSSAVQLRRALPALSARAHTYAPGGCVRSGARGPGEVERTRDPPLIPPPPPEIGRARAPTPANERFSGRALEPRLRLLRVVRGAVGKHSPTPTAQVEHPSQLAKTGAHRYGARHSTARFGEG